MATSKKNKSSFNVPLSLVRILNLFSSFGHYYQRVLRYRIPADMTRDKFWICHDASTILNKMDATTLFYIMSRCIICTHGHGIQQVTSHSSIDLWPKRRLGPLSLWPQKCAMRCGISAALHRCVFKLAAGLCSREPTTCALSSLWLAVVCFWAMALDTLRYGNFKPTCVAAEAKTLPGYGGEVQG